MDFQIKLPVIIETLDEALKEIMRADSIIEKDYLSRTDFDKIAKVTSGTLIRKFGNWQVLLEKAGIGNKYQGPSVTAKLKNYNNRYLTNEEILNEIKRIAAFLGRNSLTRNDIRENSEIIADSIIVNRFGSLKNGLELAGLKSSEFYRERIDDRKYLENILVVWTFHGRQPTFNEMSISPSEISKNAYLNRFGSWRKALEAFIAYVKNDNNISADEEMVEVLPFVPALRSEQRKPEENRSIPLGLRYRVLSAANFKCKRCGNSPALDSKCRLHIDHIIPFSKGGKTVFENLQVLCEECNLGKGNRYEE